VSKREIVTRALDAHLEGAAGQPERGPLTIEPGQLTVGRHRFLAAEVPEVLTLAQAAELLQVSEDGLAAMAEAGELPGRRVAGEWRFSHAALLAWLAAAG
jgi:excisionase family DNA binding protein